MYVLTGVRRGYAALRVRDRMKQGENNYGELLIYNWVVLQI